MIYETIKRIETEPLEEDGRRMSTESQVNVPKDELRIALDNVEPELVQKEPKIDWLMLAAIAGLMLIGVAFIYSASTQPAIRTAISGSNKSLLGLGLGLAAAVCFVRCETISRFSIIGYWLSIVLLLRGHGFRHIAFRREALDFDLGFFQFQPSEFAKLAFIFMIANFLSRPRKNCAAADFLKGAGDDRVALCYYFKGAGSWFGPGLFSHSAWR